MKPIDILNKYWGYDAFRELQEPIIQSILSGKDTLALMPTGGGKSITFQVPALMQEGLCLVITPLVALMKDQVQGLKRKEIKAEAIYTGLTRAEIQQIINRCIYTDMKLLYVSPERIEGHYFRQYLANMPISMIAVDEAHCISQWGYDFRPSYLKIANIRELFPDVPVLAVTATATQRVVKDIQEKLAFKESNVFKKSFERKNLSYIVRTVEDKFQYLLKILTRSNGSAIVYVRSRKKTKEIATYLQDNGISSTFFHAGLPEEVKTVRQQSWTENKVRVIVATNAFGMGIDKPDVRVVVHIDLPDSLEAYFQEAGRAGRDEHPAFAVLLYHPSDRAKLQKRISQKFPKKKTVRKTYTAVSNFLGLMEGEGANQSFALDIGKFVTKFKLSLSDTYNSLALLKNAGAIDFIEELDNPSRILFRMQRDDLYSFQVANKTLDNFIKLLLRMYSGVFTDYVRINEYNIAKKTKLTVEQVKTTLILLAKEKVIYYVPRIKSPYIFYPDGRIPENYISLDKHVYKIPKQLYQDKILSVVKYAEHKHRCRSQMLLAYFDDYSSKPCGHCDVCVAKKKNFPPNSNVQAIAEAITSALKSDPIAIKDLEMQFDDTDTFHLALFWLLDNKKICLFPKNQVALC
ncbi:RecQ family ATP-dependent DNA helicase [Balneicella halophila]|uniref:RecQ family ATP-dependent DNA helicase n=1 Tax=Balneicella halophila TaxID=1537566 RepID=UPI001A9CA867|nr:ATP-dependent DNA helicase RecQ [Balneicella halophila]